MLYSSNSISLDGVVSDPHVWHPAYTSDDSLALLAMHSDTADAMLLGGRTYDEFASFWPHQDDDVPLARRTNEIAEHVVTTGTDAVEWSNSSVVEGEPFAAVRRLKEAHEQIMLPGSATVLRALLRAGVIDELRFYLDPIVLGGGTRLFDGELGEIPLELVDERATPKGVRYLAYRPTA